MPKLAVRSDEELMVAYVAGDSSAFKALFQRYAPVLLRLMRRELHAREEANDLVQQTFLQLHRARCDFDAGQPFRPWLLTIALNLKREYFRRRQRRPERALDDGSPEPSVPPLAHKAVDARRSLEWAMERLPGQHRLVIELHWMLGLTFAEIGDHLAISPATAKVQAHRGYVRLRELLNDDVGGSA